MSLSSSTTQQAQTADFVFESREGGAQRVAIYPIDFGITSNSLAQQLEKHTGIDFKHQNINQKHFYTGDVIRADSNHNCGSSNNVFIPHGVGTLVCLLYSKNINNNSNSSSVKSSASIGIPYNIIVNQFGEIEELRDCFIFTFSLFKGSFKYGARFGKGKLTVYPRYIIECIWDNDAPILEHSPCVLRYLSKSYNNNNNNNNNNNKLSCCNSSTSEEKILKRLKKHSSTSTVLLNNDITLGVTSQYIGMISLISCELTPNRSSFAGLSWAEQVRFVPDGVGEILYSQQQQQNNNNINNNNNIIRYCGCWQSGQRHGFGTEYDPATGTIYMGGFIYDYREGSGTLHYYNTGTLISGNWKEGKLTDSSNVELPTWPFMLQGGVWKSYKDWYFDSAMFVRSSSSLSGVWEPLFVIFDEMLAAVARLQQGSVTISSPILISKEEKEEEDNKENNNNNNDNNRENSEESNFMPLLTSMIQRPEFLAVLAPFQRCFYFLYKPCNGIHQKSYKDKIFSKEENNNNNNNTNEIGIDRKEKKESFEFQQSFKGISSSSPTNFFPPTSIQTTREELNIFKKTPHSRTSLHRTSSLRFQQQLQEQEEEIQTNDSIKLPSLLLELRELGRQTNKLPTTGGRGGSHNNNNNIANNNSSSYWSCPSWCEEMFISNNDHSIECFHTCNNNNNNSESLYLRMSPTRLFQQAMHDIASFVSSVRLRLLSYAAVHPAASDLSVNQKVLSVCWDSVFALVAPVIYELAAAAEAENVIKVNLSFKRCSLLNREDFIPLLELCLGKEETTFSSCEEGESENNEKEENNNNNNNNNNKEEEERILIQRLINIFASPIHHTRRVVEQTMNGQLLWFNSPIGNKSQIIPTIYYAPSEIINAFAAVYHYSLSLFPQTPILQERWMSYCMNSAFKNMKELTSCELLSPPAVLRILQFLSCEVTPVYPFSIHLHKELKQNNNNNNREEEESGNIKTGLSSFITSSSTRKEVSEVISVLSAAHIGVERLKSIYPNIRWNVPPILSHKSNNNNNNNNNNKSNSRNNKNKKKRIEIVYPLDELEIRTRFILLAAAEMVQQQRNRNHHSIIEDNGWNSDTDDDDDNNNNNNNNNEREEVSPEMNKEIENYKVEIKIPRVRHIQWVLRLPIYIMEKALKQYVEERSSDFIPTQDENSFHNSEQLQLQLQQQSIPSLEVLLWVVECIGSVLESQNYPTGGKSFISSKKGMKKQQSQSNILLLGSSVKEIHVDPVDSPLSRLKNYLCESKIDKSEISHINNNNELPKYLSFQWTHFLPIITSSSSFRNTNNSTSGEILVNEKTDKSKSIISHGLLSDIESLRLSLLKDFLSDLGIYMELHMRFCFDNEEDALLSLPTRKHNISLLSTEVKENNLTFTKTKVPKTIPRCVGKDMRLTLKIIDSFLGSRAWEVLSNAWLTSLLTLRTIVSSSSSSSQYVKRKPVRTDVGEYLK